MAKQYLNNKSLYEELLKSKAEGKLTNEAIKLLQMMVKKTVNTMAYNSPMDREDCESTAMLDILKYWKNFNPEKSTNAFAYFSSVIFTGACKGWNELHPKAEKENVSIASATTDLNGIYTL